MKTRNSNNRTETVQQGGCCSPAGAIKQTANDACCEQPTDGTSCCDKSESREINSATTGCC